jgi:hypothetical protein
MFTETAGAGANTAESTGAAPKSNPPGSGVLGEVANVLSAVRLAVSSAFDLLALETRRAGLTLIWMIALGLVTAMLAITAWLGLMAALALCAVAWGLSWIGAILILVVINLSAASAVVFMCVKMSQDLLFAASRRQFANRLPAQPPPK